MTSCNRVVFTQVFPFELFVALRQETLFPMCPAVKAAWTLPLGPVLQFRPLFRGLGESDMVLFLLCPLELLYTGGHQRTHDLLILGFFLACIPYGIRQRQGPLLY